MSLGGDELVAVSPLGILDLVIHDLAVEDGEKVADRKASAKMPDPEGFELFKESQPYLSCKDLQFQFFFCAKQLAPPYF